MENLIRDLKKVIEDNLNTKLPVAYFYSSLALCLTDAIFSISVLYQSVENTVKNLSQKLEINIRRNGSKEFSLEQFLKILNNYSDEDLAFSLFKNKQLTSTRSGITKALAVKLACKVLLDHGINNFVDVNKKRLDSAEQDFIKIKGQNSGISYKYFCMLAGDENLIKPDRMICRFIANSLEMKKDPTPKEAEKIFQEAFIKVSEDYPKLTPRFLDYIVWDFQRKIKKK